MQMQKQTTKQKTRTSFNHLTMFQIAASIEAKLQVLQTSKLVIMTHPMAMVETWIFAWPIKMREVRDMSECVTKKYDSAYFTLNSFYQRQDLTIREAIETMARGRLTFRLQLLPLQRWLSPNHSCMKQRMLSSSRLHPTHKISVQLITSASHNTSTHLSFLFWTKPLQNVDMRTR